MFPYVSAISSWLSQWKADRLQESNRPFLVWMFPKIALAISQVLFPRKYTHWLGWHLWAPIFFVQFQLISCKWIYIHHISQLVVLIYEFTCIYIYRYSSLSISISISLYIYVYTHICIYIYLYIYIHIYTYCVYIQNHT